MADLYFTILRDFCFSPQIQYTAAGKENLQNYNLVTDTPLYVTALQSGINASEVRLPCTSRTSHYCLHRTSNNKKRVTHRFLSVGEI